MDPAPNSDEERPSRTKVAFPLWAKLGGVFGGLIGLAIAGFGYFIFQSDVEEAASREEAKLVGLAQSLVGAIDGEMHASFRSSADMERPEYVKLREWLRSTKRKMGVDWIGTSAADDKGRFYYVVDGGEVAPYPVGYPLFDGAAFRHKALIEGFAYDPALQDEWGTWVTAAASIVDAGGKPVAVLEVSSDADAQALFAKARREQLLLLIALAFVVALVSAVLFSRYLNRHLSQLTTSALDVAAGDLDQQVHIPTRDEIGVLGGAFNTMVDGLRERDHIRTTFGRYVSREVASQVLKSHELRLGGEARVVTVLMSDLRGFTSLSETLAPQSMVALLNRYFSRMSEVIEAHKGTIGELVGDGMVVYFGAPNKRPDDPLRAVACAVAMQRAMVDFAASEAREMTMGIGIATGNVIAGNIGGEQRMKYGVVGTTINRAARLEAFTIGSQVLIDTDTHAAIETSIRVGTALVMRAKGQREPIPCWPIKAVGAPFNLDMPARNKRITVPVDFVVRCYQVHGKEVSDEAQVARALQLGKKFLQLETEWAPDLRASFKLALQLSEDVEASNIYGKVAEVTPSDDEVGYRVEIAFTSIPPHERELLANEMAPV